LLYGGGETTVTVKRMEEAVNQEPLAAVTVGDMPGLFFITLATDGETPTDAAGAVVTGDSLHRAQAQMVPEDFYQERFCSFFDGLVISPNQLMVPM
jgi:glycerate-2-kinase